LLGYKKASLGYPAQTAPKSGKIEYAAGLKAKQVHRNLLPTLLEGGRGVVLKRIKEGKELELKKEFFYA